MNKKKKYFFISISILLFLLIISPLPVGLLIQRARLNNIQDVYEKLCIHMKNQDYDAFRKLCTSDFSTGNGQAFDNSDIKELARFSYFSSNPRTHGESEIFYRENGIVEYMPFCSWSGGNILGIEIPVFASGEYYEFKKEDGQWKFTGKIGHYSD